MENKTYEDEIDIKWLLYALLRKIWLIIAVAVISACLVAGYTFWGIKPTYTSSATMLVLAKETTLTSLADLQIGSQLTNDYSILITSRPVLEEVIENLGLDMSYKDLRKRISITNKADTRILNISVTLNDAKMAKTVVNELCQTSSKFVGEMMEVAPPKIVEEGESTGIKTGPNVSKNALIGFLAGGFLVCAILVVNELMNDSIRTEEDVKRYLDLPTLALVPDKEAGQKKDGAQARKGR